MFGDISRGGKSWGKYTNKERARKAARKARALPVVRCSLFFIFLFLHVSLSITSPPEDEDREDEDRGGRAQK